MFWTLKSLNEAGNPSFWTILAYLRQARRAASSDLAPVQTWWGGRGGGGGGGGFE